MAWSKVNMVSGQCRLGAITNSISCPPPRSTYKRSVHQLKPRQPKYRKAEEAQCLQVFAVHSVSQ